MLTRALLSALSCLHPLLFFIFLRQAIPPFFVLHSLHKSRCQTLLGNSLRLLSVPEVISRGEHNLWKMEVHSKVSFHVSLNVGREGNADEWDSRSPQNASAAEGVVVTTF